MARGVDLPEAAAASSSEVNMTNRIINWALKIVNRRICSVDEFHAILERMKNEAQYDKDGFISIGELVKLLMKSYRSVRRGIDD